MTQDDMQIEEFKSLAEEMLACFSEGIVDFNSNFDCQYEYGSMRYGAWVAGYAKGMEQE